MEIIPVLYDGGAYSCVVIPAKAGIQQFKGMDSHLRGNDTFCCRIKENWYKKQGKGFFGFRNVGFGCTIRNLRSAIHDQIGPVSPFPKFSFLFPLLMGLLYMLCLSSHVGAGDDNQYLLLGHALATGRGYRVVAFPDAPLEKMIPPGYPMVLAPVLFTMGDIERSIIPLRVLTVLLTVGFVWATFTWLSRLVGAGPALVMTGLTAFSPYTVEGAGLITADACYAFVSLLGLLVIDRWLMADDRRHGEVLDLAFVIFFCATAYLVRTIGVALLIATLISLTLRRRYRSAMSVGLGFLVLALPWNLWILSEGGDTYLHQLILRDVDFPALGRVGLPDMIRRVVGNGWLYLSYLIPGGLVPPLVSRRMIDLCEAAGLTPLLVAVRLGISGLVVWGVRSEFRGRPTLAGLYLVCYGLILLIWPWAYWRFVLPLIPLFWLGLYRTMRDLGRPASDQPSALRALRPFNVGAVGLVLLGSFVRDADYVSEAAAYRQGVLPPTDAALQSAFRWIRAHTPPESVLMCVNVPQFYVFTGRRCIRPPSLPIPDVALEAIAHNHVQYVVSAPYSGYRVNDLDALFVRPMLLAYPDLFTQVYRTPQTPGVAIYAVSGRESDRLVMRRLSSTAE